MALWSSVKGDAHAHDGRRRSHRSLLLLSVATAIGLAAYHGRERPPITAGDYAHYLLHAKALVENRPYSETGYIFTSANPHIGPVTLPPGVPLVIAPIVALDGVNSPWLRVAMVGTLCAFLL